MQRALGIAALLAGCRQNAPQPQKASPPQQPALELQVSAKRWLCQITYPDGAVDSTLHVPAGRTVRLTLNSEDVDHEVQIADAGIDVHAVPGRPTTIELRFERPERVAWQCPVDVPPGQPASSASRPLIVDSADGFAQYLAPFEADLHPKTPEDRLALGRKLVTSKGCVSCHTIDGTPRIGPTLKGMFGGTITLDDGTPRTIDEAAIREALRTPAAFVRRPYPPVMPSYEGNLTPVQLDALVQYVRSLAGS